MKKIWVSIIAMMILMMTMVSATNVSVKVWSPTDIHARVRGYSKHGDVNYYIDGKNFDNEVNTMKQSISQKEGFSVGHVLGMITEAVGYEYDTTDRDVVKIKNLDPSELTYPQNILRTALSKFFVPRYEYNQLRDRVRQQQLEIEAIQSMFSEDDLCSARVRVADKYGMHSVTCDGDKYINNKGIGEFIYAETVEVNRRPRIINITKKTTEDNTQIREDSRQRYKELCEQGIEKFCLVLDNTEE